MSIRFRKKNDGIASISTNFSQDPPFHPRMMELFAEIDREFKALQAENLELKNRLRVYEEVFGSEILENQEAAKKAGANQTMPNRILPRRAPKSPSLRNLYRSQWEIHREYSGHRDGVVEVSVCPSKPVCFGTASLDRTARIWDFDSTLCRYSYAGHKGAVNSIRFHPNEPLVCTASGDRTCHIWKIPAVMWNFLEKASQKRDVEGGKDTDSAKEEKKEAESKVQKDGKVEEKAPSSSSEPTGLSGKNPLYKLQDHTDVVTSACWVPNYKSRLVTGSWDQTLILWDVADDKPTALQKLIGHEQKVTYVEVHPRDEMVLSSSRDSTFRIWDLRKSGAAVNVSQGHTGTVSSAIFASVGSYVVSAAADRTIKVWDLKFMKAPFTVIRVGEGVSKISISPFTSTIAAPLDSGEVRLYDLSGGQLAKIPRSFPGHQKKVMGSAWSLDEATLVTCGYTEQVISWTPATL